jgi:hypothetical protein
MRLFLTFMLMTAGLQAAAPLAVVNAVREGQPPYEDSDRLYRVEGEGCDQLRPGRVLLLVRPHDPRLMGQLEVVKTAPGFALARIRQPGATYPLKGDEVIPREPLRTLPSLPSPGGPLLAALSQPATLALPVPRDPLRSLPGLPSPGRALALAVSQPAAPALPVPPPAVAHREPIFFLPEQAILTPAARSKLKAWVAAWGRAGRWVLALPPAEPSPLDQARITALREELNRLGVAKIELGSAATAPPGKYPAVYVELNPC